MASGRPLAEAFVRIKPDTNTFGRDLKKQVQEGIAPAAKAIDEGLVKKLGQQVEDANRRVQRSQLGVTAAEQDLTAARARLTKVTADANATDEQKAKAALAVQRAELKHADAVTSVAKAQDHARESSAKLTKALTVQETQTRRTSKETEVFGRRLQKALDAGIDLKQFSSLAQKLRDLKTVFNATLKPIQQFSTRIAKLAVVASAASAALLAGTGLAGGVLALAGALAEAAGAAPVAVSGLAALVAVFATVKVATAGVADGLKEVVKANSKLAAGAKLSKADTAKLAEALKLLAPNARAFVLEINRLLPGLRKVQQAVQQRFFAGFAQDVRALAERHLPALSKAGQDLATLLNQNLRGAVKQLTTSTVQWNFAAVLSDARRSAQAILPVFQRVPALLVNIAAAAGPAFRGLANDLSRVLSGTIDKLEGAVRSGALTEAINAGIAAIKNFGRIVGSVFSVVRSVVRAASAVFGGDLLTSVGDVAKKIAEFLKSAEGQEGLRRIFAGALPVLKQLGGLLKQVGPQLASLAPVVFQLASAFLTGLAPVIPVAGELARTLGEALAEVLPAVSAVAVAVGQALTGALRVLKPLIKPLADAIATLLSPTGLLNEVFTALGPVLLILAEGLGRVVTIIGGALTTAVKAIAPTLPALATALSNIAIAIAQGLADALIQVAPLLPTLVTSFTQLLVALTPLIPEIFKLLPPMLELAVQVLPPLVDILAILAPALTGLIVPYVNATAVTLEFATITQTKATVAVRDFLVKLLEFERALPTIAGVVASFGHGVGVTIAGGFAAAIRTVRSFPGLVKSALGGLAATLVGAVGGALAVMRRAIATGVDSALAWFRTLPGRILGALGDLTSTLYQAGRDVMSGLISGITSMLSPLSAALSSVSSFIASHKGPPEKDRRLLVPAGRAVMTGLVTGIEAGRIDLGRALARVTGQISATPGGGLTAGAGGAGVSSSVLREALDGVTLLLRDPLGNVVAAQLATAGSRGRAR